MRRKFLQIKEKYPPIKGVFRHCMYFIFFILLTKLIFRVYERCMDFFSFFLAAFFILDFTTGFKVTFLLKKYSFIFFFRIYFSVTEIFTILFCNFNVQGNSLLQRNRVKQINNLFPTYTVYLRKQITVDCFLHSKIQFSYITEKKQYLIYILSFITYLFIH